MATRRESVMVSWLLRPLEWFAGDQTEWVNSRSTASLPYWVALGAGLGLFMELAVVRWHSALFPLFGFYKNFSLLSAFVGLGIGYAVGKRRPVRLGHTVLFLCAQLALFGVVKVMGWHHVLKNPVLEMEAMGLEATEGWSAWFGAVAFLGLSFVLNLLAFVPIGQVTAALMTRVPNLRAYGANLLGSLAGIALFTFLSYLWMPPEVWFAVVLAGVVAMHSAQRAMPWAVTAAGIFFVLFCAFEPRPLRRNLYSPYQALSVRPVNDDSRVVVSVNQLYFQKILDLSRGQALRNANTQFNSMSYDMPFQLSKSPREVLIVGSGTGNDVAAALRRGAGHIDAVEIDPVVQKIGAELHPEKPYQDNRVTVFIDDARGFLRGTSHSYDLIVYGLLDSHTMLSSLSNVRLDSFVYTVDAFREAKARLKSDGMLALSFSVISDGLGHKLYAMLEQAFGEAPVVFQPGYDGGVLFLAGPGTKQMPTANLQLPNIASRFTGYKGKVDVSTDDWPFFYMPERKYPLSYAAMVLVLLLLSISCIRTLVPTERRSGVALSSWFFFFLGAGFLLIEARAITELGLTFGNTWMVVAVVCCGILLMAFAANLLMTYWPSFPPSIAFAGIAVTLGVGYWAAGQAFWPAVAPSVKALLAVSPMFFSGLLFSGALRDHASVSSALSANLFGSVCGGLLEYHSMVGGFRSLYLLGFGLYACACLAHYWQVRTGKASSKASGKFQLRKAASAR